jgi:hypothetical protein
MTKADELREHAERCRRLADSASDRNYKLTEPISGPNPLRLPAAPPRRSDRIGGASPCFRSPVFGMIVMFVKQARSRRPKGDQ